MDFLLAHGLDIFTTLLGFLYVLLEYKAHIAVWIVGIIMPALDVYLYYSHGLYGDAGMAVYYTLAAAYGYWAWRWGRRGKEKQPLAISHFPPQYILPAALAFAAVWAATWFVLSHYTQSSVPVLDAFTNALSIVGLWALARKYVEQWFLWIAVDAVCTFLYVQKGIPFKALLYGTYVIIAALGYFKWRSLMSTTAKG